MEQLFKDWINHTKEGCRRTNLQATDVIWKKLIHDLQEWEKGEDINLVRLAKSVLYTGELRRIHKDHEEIEYDNHYVSWTVAKDLSDIFWFDDNDAHTIIFAKATKANPGISVKGFIQFMKEFEDESYELNSPAIRKEQEVIFPLQESSKIKVEQFN